MRHALGEALAVGALAVAVVLTSEGVAAEAATGVAKLHATGEAGAPTLAVAMAPVARATEEERGPAPRALQDE